MTLDNFQKYKDLDTGQVAESIELLANQIKQVVKDAKSIKIPKNYKKISQVVVAGMGGSNIGVEIIKSAFSDRIKVPISILAGYDVPANVNQNTLYILSSYSGSTEEPLSTYNEARKRKAKILAITAHGEKNKLENLMAKDNIPGLIFDASDNPSGQPRLGLGFAIFGMALLMSKAGLFTLSNDEIKDIVSMLEKNNQKLQIQANSNINQAKQIAKEIYGKQAILIGAEFTQGNIKAMRNQICESSKNFASFLNLPDLNHFAMEGLRFPKNNSKSLAFVFFDSSLYHERIQKRSKLTQIVVKKNNIKVVKHTLKANTKAKQAFELLQLGTWISYYLGILNQIDPVKIPWVDWFKEQLK